MITQKDKTIAIDFDGVIHRYSKGWHDGTAYDPPMDGAIEYIQKLMQEYCVYVFSTRDPGQITNWLAMNAHEIHTEIIPPDAKFWSTPGVLGVAQHKVVAFVWLDDRALRFEGNWERAYMSIQNLIAGKPVVHAGTESDGYHTFNELYRHRYVLFVALMRAEYEHLKRTAGPNQPISNRVWISKLHEDGTMFDDSFIVGMQLKTGQVSYHLPMREWERVAELLPEAVRDRAPGWDGHTPADVLDRLERAIYDAASPAAA